MCGITGIIGKSAQHHLLPSMMKLIQHRGPDGQGQWQNEYFSLGHLRLSIIDLSDRAAQPMLCSVSGNIIVFNGEIYNFKEIKAELANKYPFQTDSDTEVVLAAYLLWGEKALSRLRGMFALAIYDKNKQQIFLARDRFGIKPLYYRAKKEAFYFSSEIKGLVNHVGFTKSVNLPKVFGFLAFRHLDTDEETFFQEIKQLPAATYTWVDTQGVMQAPVTYWSPPQPGEKPFEADDEAKFRAAFEDSISMHLRSDVPVGSFVSGGLDSSSIATVAYALLGKDYTMHTYSSILKEKNEENALVADVQVFMKNAIHHGPILDGINFLDELPKIIYHHDEPIADASMYAHWELCKLAKQNGIKVLLSGNGGDEVLGGYAAYVYALLGRFLQKVQLVKLWQYITRFNKARHESKFGLLLHAIHHALPIPIREKIKSNEAKAVNKLLNHDVANAYSFYTYKTKDAYESNYTNNLKAWTVPPFLHYEDRNSMAHGVEIRVPMLDHIFLTFSAAYRPEDLLNGQTKNLLRRSLRGLVPDAVLDQKMKQGFPAPLEAYIMRDKDRAFQVFEKEISTVPFFNKQEAMQIATAVIKHNKKEHFTLFWRVLSCSIWYNQFFKNE